MYGLLSKSFLSSTLAYKPFLNKIVRNNCVFTTPDYAITRMRRDLEQKGSKSNDGEMDRMLYVMRQRRDSAQVEAVEFCV